MQAIGDEVGVELDLQPGVVLMDFEDLYDYFEARVLQFLL